MNIKEMAELCANNQPNERIFYQLLKALESSDDPSELRDIIDTRFWCNLPMWLISRTFTRLINLEGRNLELLKNYSDFLSIYCGHAMDVPDGLQLEAIARRNHQNNRAEKAFRSFLKSCWADMITIDGKAPAKFRPGCQAMVYAEIFKVRDSKMAAQFNNNIGEWICEILFNPTTSTAPTTSLVTP